MDLDSDKLTDFVVVVVVLYMKRWAENKRWDNIGKKIEFYNIFSRHLGILWKMDAFFPHIIVTLTNKSSLYIYN